MEQNPYEKPLKRFLILLSLLIISPIILSIAFKALRIYKESPKSLIAYTLIILGVSITLYTVYYGIKTIKVLLNVLFRK